MPEQVIPKTCILCKYLFFDSGDQAYCEKNHWDMEGNEVMQKEYTQNMMKANTCLDFEMSKEVKHA